MRIVIENHQVWEVREEDILLASFTTRKFAEDYVKMMQEKVDLANQGKDVIHG
jgi:hypothetical protein